MSSCIFYAVIHDKEKSTLLSDYCMSPMGCRFQMLLGHTFVFGDIGLRRKKLKNLKLKNVGFSSPDS